MNRDLHKPRQLAFDLPLDPAMGREDFLATPANEAALAEIQRWPERRTEEPALALLGPPGSGRTHLAEIWRTENDALRATTADLDVDAVPRLLTRGALVLEDVPGDSLDETALFHLLNLARQRRAHVLLTTTIAPPRWPVGLPDLKSRLSAIPVVRLEPPDDLLLRAVLAKQFADRQLKVGEDVLSYLLPRMERSLSFARDLVAELDARSLEQHRRITRHLAAKVLRELMPTLFDDDDDDEALGEDEEGGRD